MAYDTIQSTKRAWGNVAAVTVFLVAALVVPMAARAASAGETADSARTDGPPRIVSTAPSVGATHVDPDLTEISVTFDRDMAGGFSWTGGGEVYPEVTARPHWVEKRTGVLPVKLEKGRYYRVGINSKSHRNFRAEHGPPALPTAIYFCTKGADRKERRKVRVPRITAMAPKNGAKDVSPDLDELRVTFDMPMGGGFSWTGGGEDYPEGEGKPRWSEDAQACTRPVRLSPGWDYRLGLNSPSHNNFQSRWGVPLPPVVWTFSTTGQAPPRDEKPAKADEAKEPGKTVVTGRVTDIEGEPIAGARLVIKKWQSGLHHYSETRSDAEGRFSLDALPSNSRLFVYIDGYASMYRTHDVAKGVNRGWDFVLPKGAHVSGRVLDTKGNPQPDRVLELSSVDSGPPPAPGVSFFASGGEGRNITDEQGVFDMPSVAPGKHAIIAYHRSPIGGDRSMQQVPVKGRLLEVEPGERVEDFEIRVNPPEDFALSGHIRDAAGNPMPGIGVDTFIPHGRHWWTKTDDDGAFYIEGLDGIGKSTFTVNFNGVKGAESFKLALHDVPVNATNIDLIVPGTGSIHGTVRNAKTGEPVTTYEVTVPVVHLPDCGAVWAEPHVKIKRDEDASFRIFGVPAGEVTVEVRAEGLGVQRFVLSVEADEANPLACEMLGPAVFAGQTTLNGEPTSIGIIIKGDWLRSDDGGNFRFDEYPNGDYAIWFFKGDGWHRTAEVHLEPGQTTRLDMEMGGSCEVRGTVVFPGEERFCMVRLAAKPAPDGWQQSGRPSPEECVLAYSHVRQSGDEYRLRNIPPGRWYLQAGKYRPSMHRSLLAASQIIELEDGETLSVDFDLTQIGE